jgi:hypothetical protein
MNTLRSQRYRQRDRSIFPRRGWHSNYESFALICKYESDHELLQRLEARKDAAIDIHQALLAHILTNATSNPVNEEMNDTDTSVIIGQMATLIVSKDFIKLCTN